MNHFTKISLGAACKLQACLTKNTYNPERCEDCVRTLYECCKDMYACGKAQGVMMSSSACPVERVVDKWLRDREYKR